MESILRGGYNSIHVKKQKQTEVKHESGKAHMLTVLVAGAAVGDSMETLLHAAAFQDEVIDCWRTVIWTTAAAYKRHVQMQTCTHECLWEKKPPCEKPRSILEKS